MLDEMGYRNLIDGKWFSFKVLNISNKISNERKQACMINGFVLHFKKVIWIVLWLHFSHHVRDSKNSLSMSQTGPLDRLCQISLSFSKKLLISTSEDLHDCTKEISMVLILSLKRHLTITRKPHNPISSSMVLVMLQYTR